MRLIFIANILNPVGGLERTFIDKSNWLVAHGHEVMLMTYMQGHEPIYYPLDKRVQHVDLDSPLFRMYHVPLYARVWRYQKIRRTFRQRMSRVVTSFKPDVISIAIPYTEDFIFDMFRVAHGVRVCIESHLASSFHLSNKPFTERLIYRLFPPIKAYRKCDLLISLTQLDAESWSRRGVKNVTIIPNPVTQYVDQLPYLHRKHGRIIAVGRMYRQKRFDRLIAAFSMLAERYPSWTLDIYGEGPLREDLQMQIESLGLLERIHLNEPTHDIMTEYQCSQFFVLSSDYEGFGLVIIESMASGTPVVATDCPYGPSEIIENGVTGLLSKMTTEDLAKKMEYMITHDEERRQMGEQARQASTRYRLDNIMPLWLKAYQGY